MEVVLQVADDDALRRSRIPQQFFHHGVSASRSPAARSGCNHVE